MKWILLCAVFVVTFLFGAVLVGFRAVSSPDASENVPAVRTENIETVRNVPAVVDSGYNTGTLLNGKATSMPTPIYPPAAKAVRAEGQVSVQVLVDGTGHVVSATALTGHPLLRGAAEQAARKALFSPVIISGKPKSIDGVLIYTFNL